MDYEQEKQKLLNNLNEIINMIGLSILKMPDDELFGVLSILLIYYLMKKFQVLGIKKFKLMEANNHLRILNKENIQEENLKVKKIEKT